MVTFHPTGLHHGPQPAARERDAVAAAASTNGEGKRRMADEVAVMIDARHALTPGPDAPTLEVPGYVESWRAGTPTSTA
jgi:homogentisate 1,2-dioxygenase